MISLVDYTPNYGRFQTVYMETAPNEPTLSRCQISIIQPGNSIAYISFTNVKVLTMKKRNISRQYYKKMKRLCTSLKACSKRNDWILGRLVVNDDTRSFHIKTNIPTPKRVVVTGLGVVSPIGLDVNTFWNNLVDGKSGIQQVPPNFEKLSEKERNVWSKVTSRVGGIINDADLDQAMDKCLQFTEATNRDKSITKSRLSKFIQFGMISAVEALSDAKLDMSSVDKNRFGVSFGSCLGAGAEIGEAYMLVDSEVSI